MSKKNRHIEHLTPELIKAYRNGELTREEQHEVERLMLESPLYEDALEGLEEFSDEMLEADLNELDSRLDSLLSEDEQKTGFWTIWRGIAAAILVLLIATSLFYLNQDKPIPNKLLTENRRANADSLPENMQTLPLTNDSLKSAREATKIDSSLIEIELDEADMVFEELVAEEETDLDISKIDSDLKELTIESLAQFKEDSINLIIPMNKMDEQIAKTIAEAEMTEALRGRAAGVRIQAESQMSQALAAPAPSKAEPNQITIKGLVTDADDNLPLPGVNIIQRESTNASITNSNGQFVLNNIAIGDSLIFSFIGYVSRTIPITDKDSLNVSLEPDDTALGEVVVVGYGIAEKKELTFSNDKASPINGYPEFNNYLKNNLEYPEEAQKENIRGRVTLEFTVEADGSLTNFEIIKGLGYGCDEEAIRLIKEGPKWLAKTNETKAVSSKVRIRIRFRP